MSRAFISHATLDRTFVETKLSGLLGALGLDVWYAESDIESSQQWERAILSGLESSKWFILVMSPRSADSEWVKDEVGWAIDNRPDSIVPILIKDCHPKEFHIRLPRIQWIDFRRNEFSARERLTALIVEREYGKTPHSEANAVLFGIRAIIEASDLPMYFLDNEFRVRFVNERLTKLFGFQKGELDGKKVSLLVNRFISLAPKITRPELKAKQDRLKRLKADHFEDNHVIDVRHLIGNRYHGMQRVWISADRVYLPQTDIPIGLFVVYHVTEVEK